MDLVKQNQQLVQCEVLTDSGQTVQSEVLTDSGQCEVLTDSGQTVEDNSGHSDTEPTGDTV